MRFRLDDEQQALAAAVRGVVERRAQQCDLRAAIERGYDRELWSALCGQVGVAALAIPAELGGAGATSFETHVVLDALGGSLTPTPLPGTFIAMRAVQLAADGAAQERLLPSLASGDEIGALAWADHAGRWSREPALSASTDAGSWSLTGTSALVVDGGRADVLLAVAETGAGAALFEARGGVVVSTPALDPTLDLATVTFDRAPATPLGPVPLDDLLAEAACAVTALQVGGAQAALDQTVRYLGERQQFGRPLGSFQALKHRAADMLVDVETARSISWWAAYAVAHRQPGYLRRASAAKAWCSEAFGRVAAEMIQLHGGIAITWEHDAHLYFKRAHATAQLFGDPRMHRSRAARHAT
ncbi:acyl-CoA/acyl-ACP dehydrogenase [Tsukamurella sp. 8F]|uniref:acyl-CoA dehydrogenase family protein n=1 Tax=unclassified Tsukamurella TaxID=2633480 RepID=UPI0023B939DD|nr:MULTISPECIES: acyl-CoA dehydrogenase family protein [unclassified Tsukamurella]MDF0528374.1 acyl-CoA/acyl-ACP dehydrogenase [Tsukamurella sp. 8J]MDF0586199.1 acyl-CoA/acyl-ACP dehydrogenase [Tsukamurella sp. 8F]